MDDLQSMTVEWAVRVRNYHANHDRQALNQVHCRGVFAGMSGHDIKQLTDMLIDNSILYPLGPTPDDQNGRNATTPN